MNHRDIAGVMAAAAPAFRDYVVRAVSPLVDRLLAVEKFVRDFQVPKDGKDADPEAMERMVSAEVARLLPAAVEAAVSARAPPKDGKDADPEAIKAAVLDVVAEVLPGEVSAAIEKIGKPKDGIDGKDGKDVDMVEVEQLVLGITNQKFAIRESVYDETVRPIVEEVVAAHVAKIAPAENGKDGKDADPVDHAEVARLVVDMIPVPKDGRDGVDGKSVTVEDIAGLVRTEVNLLELPQGPPGEAGKSVEMKDLIPVVAAEVEKAVSAIERPKDGAPGQDGKSVTVEEVRPLLEGMVAAIQIPAPENGRDGRDGKDADPVEIAALITDDVAKMIPVPENGKSVTLEDVAPMIEDAVAKKLPNLLLVNEAGVLVAVYPNGEPKLVGKVRGEDGLCGASVMDGHVDEDGTLALRMSDGRIIQTGRVKGDDGKDGEPGQKGEPGRDAYEIQILSGVDEHKSYVEGVVANWRGGLIRSVRQTDPIVDGDIITAGWKVQLQGIAEEYEDYTEDGRYLERTTVYTDGTEFKRRHKTVTPIYQGTWKEDVSYSKGDEITWSGSSFIAMKDNQAEKPQLTDAWKLKTKRGRDGKDGKTDRPSPVVKLDRPG